MSDEGSSGSAETVELLREQNALLREQKAARERRVRVWQITALVVVVLLVIAVPVIAKIRADAASARFSCEIEQTMMGYTAVEARAYCR